MSSKKNFAELSKEECSQAYKLFIDTAERRWQDGINLAYKGSYGYAISTLFTSIEDHIKSLVIFLDGKGFRFRNMKEVECFFEDHQIRYIIAFAMFGMSIAGDELKKFILRIREKPDEAKILYNEMKTTEDYFEKKLLFYFKRKMVVLRNEFAWFSKAEIFKQAGMYCDFKDMFASPLNVGKEEYKEVFKRLERVKEVVKFMVAGFESTDNSVQKEIEKMKASFETNDHYKKISDILIKLSASRMTAFDYVRKLAQPLE